MKDAGLEGCICFVLMKVISVRIGEGAVRRDVLVCCFFVKQLCGRGMCFGYQQWEL